jgi:serine phosphatase RsbU (regulator of sigma subunit)/anti-sigma regulatory factor (Ser/Thr protein kinase)
MSPEQDASKNEKRTAPDAPGGQPDFFSCSIPCHIDAVRDAVSGAGRFLRQHGANDEEVTGCELAIAEACNNAVLYVTEEQRSFPIGLQISRQPDCVEVQVIDHTPGFEWPKTLALPDSDVEHGRGLFIIRRVMDSACYLRGAEENRLIMRKRLVHTVGDRTTSRTEENQRYSRSGPENSANSAPERGTAIPQPDGPARNAARPEDGKVADPVDQIQQQLTLSQHVITTMAGELCQQIITSRIQKEDLDNRLLARELEIARNIQQSLLPKTFPSVPGFSIGGYCVSARQVGGDFYDVLPLADGTALLAVADVMGKGVPAALFAATLRTLLRTTAEWTHSPAEILARVNRLMHDELSAVDMFITAQLLLVNCDHMTVASAGHCPLLCIDNDGDGQVFSPDGMPLGIVRDYVYEEQTIPLENVTCALLYTDGLTEARNADGALFGQQRLLDWLKKGMTHQHSPDQFTRTFLEEMALFQSHDSLKDDQTFLVLARIPSISSLSSAMTPGLTAFAELNLQSAKA